MHQYWIGGGFGRSSTQTCWSPPLAAPAVGRPVKVIYSREHDMMMDFSRPLIYQKISRGSWTTRARSSGSIMIWSAPGRP